MPVKIFQINQNTIENNQWFCGVLDHPSKLHHLYQSRAKFMSITYATHPHRKQPSPLIYIHEGQLNVFKY